MLTSAADYQYINTQGVEQGLTGNIIPTSDVAGLQAPYRFEDFCYISEATRVWSFNYFNIGLSPQYVQTFKRAILERAWEFIYKSMLPTNNDHTNGYGCAVYLNDGITQLPVQPRFNPSTVDDTDKRYFVLFASNLLFDYTGFMDACIWQTSPGVLSLTRQKFDVIVPRLLYWILFQPCWQQVFNATDTASVPYDKTYTFVNRGLVSGNAQWHTSDSGNVVTHTTTAETIPNQGYVQPAVNTNTTARPTWTSPVNLRQLRLTSPLSGYEYCYDGITGDAVAQVELRRSNVIDAYAFVEYRATNSSNYSTLCQYKFEPMTLSSGNIWTFKCFDYNFAKALLEAHGADYNNIGRRTTSQSAITSYSLQSFTYRIFVRYDHLYSRGISQQWQWQPQ